MKKLLLLPLILLTLICQGQDKTPTPDQVRMMIAQSITDLKVAPESIASIRNIKVPNGQDSIPIRIYQPASDGPLPVIYLVHGGAWVAGDLDTHDNICRYLANHVKAVVVAVHYRRPPEHKFPAAYSDSYAVLQWISKNQQALNSNGQLVLLGDSAGGQIVAALCLANAATNNPIPIQAQVLVNPGLDVTRESPAFKTYGLFIQWYVSDNDDLADIRLSPLLAISFRGLPPAIIAVGENDEIRQDGERFHQKLQEAGIKSELFVQPKAGHLGGLFCAAHEAAKPVMDFVVSGLLQILQKNG